MNSHSTRQATLRHLPVLAASLLLLLISCGGQGEEIEIAQKHIRRGELDEAERVLAEGVGDGVERLLGEVRLAQLARAEFHSKLDAGPAP